MPEQYRQEARATSAGFFIFVHQFLSGIVFSPTPRVSDRHNRNANTA